MDEDKVNSIEYKNRRIITGKTTIDHQVRVELRLTVNEYCLCDCLYEYRKIHPNDPISFRYILKHTGLCPKDVDTFARSLKERGVLVAKNQKIVTVYDQWRLAHNSDDKFEIIWKIHPLGNRAEAKGRLPKVLKLISFEELVDKLKKYLADCKANDIYVKHLATWLNPLKQHWNDTLTNKQQEPVTKQQPPIRFK